MSVLTEADTCTKYVVPKLKEAGWDADPHLFSEQHIFTDGRIVVTGNKVNAPSEKAQRRLPHPPSTPPLTFASWEGEAVGTCAAADGMHRRRRAESLGYFSPTDNGQQIIELNYLTGIEREIDEYPSPRELWQRLQTGHNLSPTASEQLLTPAYHLIDKGHRYYQQIAVNRGSRRSFPASSHAADDGDRHGKNRCRFSNLLEALERRWNRGGEHRRPKILYLADRNILIDDPKEEDAAPFGDARHKIEGEAIKSRGCISPSIRRSHRMRTPPACTRDTRRTFLT